MSANNPLKNYGLPSNFLFANKLVVPRKCWVSGLFCSLGSPTSVRKEKRKEKKDENIPFPGTLVTRILHMVELSGRGLFGATNNGGRRKDNIPS